MMKAECVFEKRVSRKAEDRILLIYFFIYTDTRAGFRSCLWRALIRILGKSTENDMELQPRNAAYLIYLTPDNGTTAVNLSATTRKAAGHKKPHRSRLTILFLTCRISIVV